MESQERKVPGPDHPITIEATGTRFVVTARGTVVADSTATLTLRETRYAPVQYFPVADVDESLLRPSPRSTYCPYKGDATYYSIVGLGRDIEDAIWTYVDPYPDVVAIAGFLAFYPEFVKINSFEDPEAQPSATPSDSDDPASSIVNSALGSASRRSSGIGMPLRTERP